MAGETQVQNSDIEQGGPRVPSAADKTLEQIEPENLTGPATGGQSEHNVSTEEFKGELTSPMKRS